MSIILANFEDKGRVHIDNYDSNIHKGKIRCDDGHELVAKKGGKKTHHYAHAKVEEGSSCCCSREMGEWHRSMENRVKNEYLEKIIIKDGVKHIADCLTDDNIVIEFQKSVISPKIIKERDTFYKKYCKDLIWIFCCDGLDISNPTQKGDIVCFEILKGSKYFLETTSTSFLDFRKAGFIQLLKNKGNKCVGKIWTLKDFDKRYLSNCLKPDADKRIYHDRYNIDYYCTDNEISVIMKDYFK